MEYPKVLFHKIKHSKVDTNVAVMIMIILYELVRVMFKYCILACSDNFINSSRYWPIALKSVT